MSSILDSARVLLVGAGGLGVQLAQQLSQCFPHMKLTIADQDGRAAQTAARSAHCFPLAPLNMHPPQWLRLDVLERQALDEAIREADVVINTASLIPVELWWRMANDPRRGAEFDKLGFGPWIALNLLLPDAIAECISASGRSIIFFNGSYPDLINACIARRRRVVPLGFGNVALLERPLRIAAAKMLGVDPASVDVQIAAHYVHLRSLMLGSAVIPPGVKLQVKVAGKIADLSGEASSSLLRDAGGSIPHGVASHPWTAAAFISALSGTGARIHMAGPNGRIGGYPVLLKDGCAELRLPKEWDEQTISADLKAAQALDGIADLTDDGEIKFTDESAALYQSLFGATLHAIRAGDLRNIAREQLALLKSGFAH